MGWPTGQAAVACFSGVILLLTSATRSSAIDLPGAPSSLAASVSGHDVTLVWTPPVSGVPILSYLLEAGTSSGATDVTSFPTGSPATQFAATSVPAGTYYVRVRAQNATGVGPASNEVVVTVEATAPGPAVAPGAPFDLVGSVAGARVVLSWRPASSGGATPTCSKSGRHPERAIWPASRPAPRRHRSCRPTFPP